MAKTQSVVNKVMKESMSNKDDPRFKIQTSQQISSALGGALMTSLFMTPLDVVKTRIQAQQKALLSNKCFLYCNGLMDHLCPCGPNTQTMVNQKPTMHLNGTVDGVIKIARYEGVASLWSGLSPTLILALPATVVYFVAYEKFKEHYCKIYSEKVAQIGCNMPIYIPLTAGMSARLLAVTIVCPLELIRTKMQSEKISYLRVYQSIRNTIATQGITGMWRGLTSTIYRDVPFSGIYWSCYESIKMNLRGQFDHATFGFGFFAGAISGGLAAFITTPFDVVKTHQQIEFGEKVIYADKPAQNVPSENIKDTFRRIYMSHGIKGLFAGLGPRLAKVAPACAIMIGCFEFGKSFFYQHNIKTYLDQQKISEALSYERSE